MKGYFPKLVVCLLLLVGVSNLWAEGDREFHLQWAVLQSAQDFTDSARGGDLAVSGLIDWDFRSGTLYDHFPNDVVGSMRQGSKYFYGTESSVSLQAGGLLEPIDIDVSVTVENLKRQWRSLQATRAKFVIRRGGEIVSAPTVRTEIGQKAITSAPGSEGQPPIYILIQVDPV